MLLATLDLPGTGGAVAGPDDFQVEEIPAYLPSGEGEHCLAWVEKRGLTTPQAIEQIARALGLSPASAGYAGLKDKEGVTRQWISLQGALPDDLLRLELPGLRVLQAGLHRNKLRTGHLKGNRFTVVLRGVDAAAVARAQQIVQRLATSGMPNYYGEQRFGRRGDNAAQGLRLLRKEGGAPRDKFKRRLLVSALQSQLFNEVLEDRVRQGTQNQLLGGEVLQRLDSGGLFVSEDSAVDGPRLARDELVITGPICGPRMPLPLPGSPARAQEEQVFAAHRLTPESFGDLGRIARGGRRPLIVKPEAPTVEALADDALRLSFALPAGSYATVLLAEVTTLQLASAI